MEVGETRKKTRKRKLEGTKDEKGREESGEEWRWKKR